mmetsp:Transcript_66675/g.168953  ORF Transcript_66675/g.168953 Transcript_66675/m.168953 type:complete len:294 (-) Transcript_66675:12-893(-)
MGTCRATRSASLDLCRVQSALLSDVEGDFVLLVVGILQDVQLTAVRPNLVAVHGPEAGPDPAARRQLAVVQGRDEPRSRLPSLVRVDVHRIPLVRLARIGREPDAAVAELRLPVVGRDRLLLVGLLPGGELVGTMDVILRHEREVVEKGVALRLPIQRVDVGAVVASFGHGLRRWGVAAARLADRMVVGAAAAKSLALRIALAGPTPDKALATVLHARGARRSVGRVGRGGGLGGHLPGLQLQGVQSARFVAGGALVVRSQRRRRGSLLLGRRGNGGQGDEGRRGGEASEGHW